MQRLIDADWFRRYVHEQLELGKTYTDDEILEMIDEQPTAYDVEAVVVELEKSATDDDGLFVSDGNEPMIWKSKAIEIVRGKE